MTLRKYKLNTPQYKLYSDMHKYQTLEYVRGKQLQYSKLNNTKMSIKKALSLLDDFIDPSDPDLDVPNSIHAYQTAERIRNIQPNNKELQIVGLIHDLGKVLFSFGEPSWSVVGDTYVLGCQFPKTIVYHDTLKSSPEYNIYDTFGIYHKQCGLDNLTLSYGHDEYLYQVLKGNHNHKISDKYLNVIRYHSFYPWHSCHEYRHLMKKEDNQILNDVLEFNQFDLYSKVDEKDITQETINYYDNLLDQFFFGKLNW